ncbi:MAG: methylcobalamin--homocysteine methyltransferase [Acidilobaceae archaeon]|nr:methylcobalamin--homocysteine methyltransferase [Acidilobaceae archaeon]MCX8165324.1 methylcobalamin--homocysteine methyltransferase [Acidilobaceae archaeon]
MLGGFPRSRHVRKVLRDYERGSVTHGELEAAVAEASALLIGAQLAAGLTYVTDGMVDWHDIFRPFVESWRNVTPTGLLRYFDNNYFYRIPLFTGKPEPKGLVLAPRVRRFAKLAEPAGLKVVLPGPYTFAAMSEVRGLEREELAEAIAKLMGSEVRAAVEAGARAVQIDEPLLSDQEAERDEAVLAAELASKVAKEAGEAKTILAVYFDVPKAEVYEALLEAKVSCLSLDVIDAPERAAKLIASKGLKEGCAALGLINARNVYDDDLGKLEELFLSLTKGYEGEPGVTTSTWLDLLPYEYGIRKARILGLLAQRLGVR